MAKRLSGHDPGSARETAAMDFRVPSVSDILTGKIQAIEARLPLRINPSADSITPSFASELSQSMQGTTASANSATESSVTPAATETLPSASTGAGLLGLQLSSLAAQALAATSQQSLGPKASPGQNGIQASTQTATGTWPRLDITQLEVIAPRIDSAISDSAARTGLDPLLLRALIANESGFQPFSLSSAGAMGLTQLMPGTAQDLGVTDPYDIRQNVDGGARYLKQQLTTFGDDLSLALAAYNAGPHAVRMHGGVPPYQETQVFVERVLTDYNRYRAAEAP
jgi:hypothetical protein